MSAPKRRVQRSKRRGAQQHRRTNFTCATCRAVFHSYAAAEQHADAHHSGARIEVPLP